LRTLSAGTTIRSQQMKMLPASPRFSTQVPSLA
jgi:hypothetical protein